MATDLEIHRNERPASRCKLLQEAVGLLPRPPFSCKTRIAGGRKHRLEGSPLSSLRVKKTTAKPEITDQIGRHLRSVYNDVLAQPVPDRFMDLLKDLDALPIPRSDLQAGEKKAVK